MDGYIKREAKIVSIRRYDETICSSKVILVTVRTNDDDLYEIEWAREAGRKPVEVFDKLWNAESGSDVVLYESERSSNLTFVEPVIA